MGKFPETFSATHTFTAHKRGVLQEKCEVVRLFEDDDGNFSDSPGDRYRRPQFFDKDWAPKFTGPGRTMTPIPGVAIKQFTKIPAKAELKPGMAKHERHALNKINAATAPIIELAPKEVESHGSTTHEPETVHPQGLTAGVGLVVLPANTMYAIMRATAFPEWQNSHDCAETVGGDSARVIHFDRSAGTKTVRVCSRNLVERTSTFHDVIIRENMTVELLRDQAED